MRRILTLFLVSATFGLNGCANINPRLNEKIDNQSGKIEDIRNNQNGIMLDLLKLRNQNDIANSQIKEMQQGMVNLSTALSRNENSGIQILQGDGALFLIFALGAIGMLLYWYRDRAIKNEKAVQILAQEVARYNDADLNDGILRAAMHTESESHVYHILTKHQKEIAKAQKYN